jgi:hypothetical protein
VVTSDSSLEAELEYTVAPTQQIGLDGEIGRYSEEHRVIKKKTL